MIVMVSYYFVIPESPRWLLLQGRQGESYKVMMHIAAINNKTLHETFDLDRIKVNSDEKDKKTGSLLDLVRTSNMRKRSLILFSAWFATTFIFYALSMNAGSLSGNIFLNSFLLGLVEIPANALFMFTINVPRIGRRISLVIASLIAGIFCLAVIQG